VLVNVVQFDEKVGLGTFARWLQEKGCSVQIYRADLEQLPSLTETVPIILLGGYMGVNDRDRLSYLQRAAERTAEVVSRGWPLLAICLGGQLLAHALGGKVHSQSRQEKGMFDIHVTSAGENDPLFNGMSDRFISFEWHNDSFDLPPEAVHLAETPRCGGQAFRVRNAWGLQFHPEVDELVVADWCQRTGAGEGALEEFRQRQVEYYRDSKRLLDNFLAFCQQ